MLLRKKHKIKKENSYKNEQNDNNAIAENRRATIRLVELAQIVCVKCNVLASFSEA